MPMNSAHASHVDSGAGLASWYTPGRSDGFGDRLLMFDNTDAISLELLRFRRELAVTSGFEDALHDRVERLAQFRHPAFPLIRAVVHLDEQDLTLVSAHTPGQRLSELPTWKLRKGLHPAIVTWIVREVTTALAALQATGPGAAHGALNADRIVLTADGRLCIVEHALAPAIRKLGLPPAVFWRQFGLLGPVDERGLVRIDPRSDVVQLGTIALALLLARPITLNDFERSLPALLDEFSAMATVSPSVFAAPLRAWLERALQLAPRSYRSAADAQDGLKELPAASGPSNGVANIGAQLPASQAELDEPADHFLPEAVSLRRLEARGPLRPQVLRELPAAPARPDERQPGAAAETTTTAAAGPPRRRWRKGFTIAIGATLAAVALGEGAIIARLGTQPTVVSVAAPVFTPRPQQPVAAAPTETPAVVPAIDTGKAVVKDANDEAIAQAAARQRSGGVKLSSPIDLNVLEGDRVLGSTADGPIVATAGTHQLELVNAALGYRSRQTVTIKAGVITPVTVPTPMGRINVNAQPWAQVLIDDSPIGDTPLANVAVPLGQHQITFRHPQLGERRETVTVRADTIARISTSFDR